MSAQALHAPRGPFTRGPSPAEWLCLALGLALVWRYRWIFDDAFIYFRYVDNLLFLRAGLVFNAGEYVEGFSSPLHCLLLIALRSLRLAYPTIVNLTGLLAFALFWLLLVHTNRALARKTGEPLGPSHFNFPLAYLATNYSLTSFFTAGNEGALLHLAAASTAYFLLHPTSRWAAIATALSPLVRPELALALIIASLFVWISQRRAPKLLLISAALIHGAWLLFRVIYYADLFPNTYYLKVGTELEGEALWNAGLRYLMDTAAPPQLGLVLVIALALGLMVAQRDARGSAWRELRCGPRGAMLLIASVLGLWAVLSGGSAMSYYYLAFPFTLTVCALGGLVERALAPWLAPAPQRIALLLTLLVSGGVFARYPETLSAHPVTRADRMHRLPSPTVVTDPSFFRHRPALDDPWPSISDMQAFAPQLASDGYARWTDAAACNTLYRNFDVRSIHGYGLTDALLARVAAKEIKRGHKPALAALALDLIRVQMAAGKASRTMYSQAIENGTAPDWLSANKKTIEILEAKAFNRHHLWTNIRLAFTFPDEIQL